MKKSILNLGKFLNKEEQKRIKGAIIPCGNFIGNTGQQCLTNSDCWKGVCHNRCCNTVV